MEKDNFYSLPVYKYQQNIIKALEHNNVLLVLGETGSGKTTQIPKILQKHFKQSKICITQPRRVAAISVALRVAQEMNTQIGKVVGYAVRFDEKYSSETRIKYVTDGMMLREAIIDNTLSKYDIIVLDEVHERSINSDTILALIKLLLSNQRKNDLKLVLMSATLNLEKFKKYLNCDNVIKIEGRSFPIEVYNTLSSPKNYLDAALITILQVHLNEDDDYRNGDILVFLPGQEDIEDLSDLLKQKQSNFKENHKKFEIFPIFSALPNEEQLKVFKPINPNHRKIILATNIAETSITINNIKFVIDTGFAKIRSFLVDKNIDVLKVTKISKNSAIQRSGRAGRQFAGKCFRLYTEEEFEQMDDFNTPEIMRANLRNLILDLKAINPDGDIRDFPFIDFPNKILVDKAYNELLIYKAIDAEFKLTEIGRKMTVLPMDPMYSKILITAYFDEKYKNVCDEIISIISLIQSDNVFYTPSNLKEKARKLRERFENPTSDHLTLLNVYLQWKENKENSSKFCKENFLNEKSLKKAEDIKKQLKLYLSKMKNQTEKSEKDKNDQMLSEMEDHLMKIEDSSTEIEKNNLILSCLLSGYFTNIAKFHANNYFTTLKDKNLCKIHPTSILIKNPKLSKNAEYLIFDQIILTNKQYLKSCSLLTVDMIKPYLLHLNQNFN